MAASRDGRARSSATSGRSKEKRPREEERAAHTPVEDLPSTSGFTVVTLATFVAVSLLYGFTAYPSIPGGDSGELVSTSWELGGMRTMHDTISSAALKTFSSCDANEFSRVALQHSLSKYNLCARH